jgi:N-acetylmuramoyl-L-alanine amidase
VSYQGFQMKIFNCFKKVVDRDVKYPPSERARIPAEKPKALNIGLVVGHTHTNWGAETYNAQREYDINDGIVNRILEDGAGKNPLFRLERDPKLTYGKAMKKLAAEAKAKGIDLVIEFHFNAAGIPEARGCESLIAEGSDISAYYAYQLSSNFSNLFQIVARGRYKNYMGVKAKAKTDRGGAFLHEMQSVGIPAIIWEPFFCDYRTRESEQFLELSDFGVVKMANFFNKFLSGI